MKMKALMILALISFPLYSQFTYFYGKNKVIRSTFHWKVVETPHFLIYHYVDDPNLTNTIAEEAERAYARISNFLGATIEKKTPIIFYNRQTDLEQTNLIPDIIPPGSFEGLTEPIGNRVVVYGNRPKDELASLVTHELTHSFENEILFKSRARNMTSFNRPPDWIMEGLAEFMMGKWDSFYLMTAIDYVVNDRIPEIQENGDIQGTFATGRTPYDIGHLMFDFFFEKHGRRSVQKILEAQQRASFVSRGKSFLSMFNYTPKTFNYEFKKYARDRFRSYFTKENPEDYSVMIGSDFPYLYAFSHQVSPSGEMVAVVTVNFRTYKLDIVLLSLRDGKPIKNITPGVRTIYDGIWNNFIPSEGRSFCWDRQARKIAFFARKELSYHLVLLDVTTGKVLERIPVPGIEKPSSPLFHPKENRLYFTAVEGLQSIICAMDLKTRQIQRITNGKMFIREFDISPDGSRIVYAGRMGHFQKLYFAPLESPDLGLQVTSGAWNDMNPSFSNNGKTVFFSTDERGTCNISALDLENRWLTSYTDVRTGNFFPLAVPGQDNQLVISAFHKGGFYLFRVDTSRFLSRRAVQFRDPGQYEIPEVLVEKGTSPFKFAEAEAEFTAATLRKTAPQFSLTQKKYRPLDKIIVDALPTVLAGVGTGGEGFYGSGAVTFADVMSDHSLNFSIYSIYGYRSYQATYLNLRRRLQYYAQLFSYSLPYYFNQYDYRDNLVSRNLLGGRAGFYYPFNRSYRAELSLGIYRMKELYDFGIDDEGYLTGLYHNYLLAPIELALVGETIRFAEYGPNMGHTFRLAAAKYFPVSDKSIDTYTLEADMRKYFRIDNNTLFALRFYGYNSGGKHPLLNWTGGNNTLRATSYSYIIGTKGLLFNAELRFPLIHAALTPLGVIGPIRGVFFFDAGRYWNPGESFRLFQAGNFPTLDDNIISSYGFGLQTYLLGIPFHFEWVYNTHLTELNGNQKFVGFRFWIGYDF